MQRAPVLSVGDFSFDMSGVSTDAEEALLGIDENLRPPTHLILGCMLLCLVFEAKTDLWTCIVLGRS